jgi:hypothetical protein
MLPAPRSRAYLDRATEPRPVLHRVVDAFAYEPRLLLAFFEQHVRDLPPGRYGGSTVGGSWAVLSSDERHDGGTEQGQMAYGAGEDGLVRRDPRAPRPVYRTPTNLYHGYARELCERVERELFAPARVRFMLMVPGQRYKWHRDAATETWRLHFPVITNERCCFEWRPWGPDGGVESLHMPIAPRPYRVRTDVEHRFVNDGETPRVHLIMNVFRRGGAPS